MNQRRLFVMITGKYRKFQECWQNMVETIVRPSQDAGLDVYLCFGLDPSQSFNPTININGVCPTDHILLEWIHHRTDPYFKMSIMSLEYYLETKKLDQSWFDYLVNRSGSCIEYTQISRLYEMVCSRYEVSSDDLMLRTRCDVVLQHPIQLSATPSIGQSTHHVFHSIFPTIPAGVVEEDEPVGREVSFFPAQPIPDCWVVTLRKNLIYLMPMTCGKVLREVAMRYGDWDNATTNDYWFNAESQFRGCLRSHDFTIWEYSQKKDECFDRLTLSATDDFPLYAILR